MRLVSEGNSQRARSNKARVVAAITEVLESRQLFSTVVAGWNFNGLTTGLNLAPPTSTGPGTASSVGMSTAASSPSGNYPTANATGPDNSNIENTAGSSDTATTGAGDWKIVGTNGWNTGAAIGSQGAQFLADTSNYNNISLQFDWGVSSTKANGQLQVQYTLDANDPTPVWTIAPAGSLSIPAADTLTELSTNKTAPSGANGIVVGTYFQNIGSATWQNQLTANFSSIAGANNNPNFGVRLVNAATGTAAVNGADAGPQAISAATESGNTVTLTAPGTYTPGETITVAGIAPNAFDGTYTVTAVASGTITYTDPTAGLTATSLTGATLGTPSVTAPSNTSANWRLDQVQILSAGAFAIPTVTTQPQSQSVLGGNTATFTVAASGNPTPTVQWMVSTGGGAFTAIPGATSTTYSLTALPANNGNQYEAVFTNITSQTNVVTSQPATLTVPLSGPAMTTQPISQTGVIGNTATFTAAASGNPTPTVQWQVSAGGAYAPVSGATSTTLSVPVTAASSGNTYEAVFTGQAGGSTATATSNPAMLTALPAITAWNFDTDTVNGTATPQGANASPNPSTATNDPVTGFATAQSLGMQLFSAPDTSSITPSTITPTSSSTDPGATDQVWKIAGTGGGFNYNAPLASQGAQFVSSTANYSNVAAQFDIYVTAQGEAKFVVQYTTNYSTPSGSTWVNAPTLVAPASDSGISVQTNSSDPNTISGSYFDVTGGAGWYNRLTADFSGIAGVANNPHFAFRVVNAATGGTDCVNTLGQTLNNTSGNWQFDEVDLAGTVSKAVAPAIFTQPTSQTVNVGSTATFSSNATGTATPTVQWFVNSSGTWTLIPGATATVYSVIATPSNSGNQYEAVFSNGAGSVTSNAVSLTVPASTPTITAQPASLAVTTGTAVTFTSTALGNPAPTVQWQVIAGGVTTPISTGVTTTYDPATDITTTTYTFTPTIANDGSQYQAVFTNSQGSTPTNLANLIVTAPKFTAWNFDTLAQAINLTPAPSTGTGTASSVGMSQPGTTNPGAFPATGAVGPDASDIVVDPGSTDGGAGNASNQAWRIVGTNGWNSATAIGAQGAQFLTSTVGYNNISIQFDLNLTAQGEGNVAVQYTTDGSTWQNATSLSTNGDAGISVATNTTSENTIQGQYFAVTGGALWYNRLTADFNGVAGVANNPKFGIRLVNASTGTDVVNSTGGAYNNTSGNWRFDEVNVNGISTTPAPTVSGLTVSDGITADGTAQRSEVTQIQVVFSEPVTLSAGAFSLFLQNTDNSGANDTSAPTDITSLALSTTFTNPSNDGVTWDLSFVPNSTYTTTARGTLGASLNDGVYQVVVNAAMVSAQGGPAMASNFAGPYFHRLFGDTDGNGQVFGTDLNRFSQAYGTTANSHYLSYLDNNGDGKIFGPDLNAFSKNYSNVKKFHDTTTTP